MASPRIFVSSTCYDLYDLRNNIYNFIKDYDYEPIMSEFGDIFYDYNLHVQDACVNEISKCQMFVLIIGNNYGSFYHKTKENDKNPKSVTMTEFQKALKDNIPKHIFINRMVKYDYDNYRRFLEKEYTKYFSDNNVENDDIESIKFKIRDEFDSNYHFAHESYKHIFKFIDATSSLVVNNAILTYETTTDIQSQLKKQWSNFMYESLIKAKEKKSIINEENTMLSIKSKLEKIDKTIESIVSSESNGIISISTNKLIEDYKFNDLIEVQKEMDKYLKDIIFNKNIFNVEKRRGYFENGLTDLMVKEWIESLGKTLESYKWSAEVPFEIVFECIGGNGFIDDNMIPYESIFKLYGIYNNCGDEQDNLIKSVKLKLDQLNTKDKEKDDMPF